MQTKARNKRLRPAFKLFATYSKLQAVVDQRSVNGVWRGSGTDLVNTMFDSTRCTIDPGVFPADGNHMRRGQILTLCGLLDLGDPTPILREVWEELDSIVSERNAVAHGRETPDEVGRRYTKDDMLTKIDLWECRWIEFIDWVEAKASSREFYLLPR